MLMYVPKRLYSIRIHWDGYRFLRLFNNCCLGMRAHTRLDNGGKEVTDGIWDRVKLRFFYLWDVIIIGRQHACQVVRLRELSVHVSPH